MFGNARSLSPDSAQQDHGTPSSPISRPYDSCRITALPPLPLMPHLQALYLQDNLISHVAPQLDMPLLAILNLAFNRVASEQSLHALATLPRLERLDLSGNAIEQKDWYKFWLLLSAALSCLKGLMFSAILRSCIMGLTFQVMSAAK